MRAWAKTLSPVLWDRAKPDKRPASTYAYYLDCGPLEPQQHELMTHLSTKDLLPAFTLKDTVYSRLGLEHHTSLPVNVRVIL